MHLLLLLLPLPALAFYLWMFWDMANNPDIPADARGTLGWPPASRMHWAVLFVVLNIVAAVIYFTTVYKDE
ncbi:MAG TPA: hypothetical protein VF466_01250 [Candidatus Saccharimonadales bacterium]